MSIKELQCGTKEKKKKGGRQDMEFRKYTVIWNTQPITGT